MLSSAAVFTLQMNFKKVFVKAEADIMMAVHQYEAAMEYATQTRRPTEADLMRSAVKSSLKNIKKGVAKFNSAAITFIALNMDPMSNRFGSFPPILFISERAINLELIVLLCYVEKR